MSITKAELELAVHLELIKRELESIIPANEPVAKVRDGISFLIHEVERLRAALRTITYVRDADVANGIARAALGEQP